MELVCKSIRCMFLLIFSILPVKAFAVNTLLISFPQLVKAVESGNNVRAIVHFDRCFLQNQAKAKVNIENFDGASTRFNFYQFRHIKGMKNDQFRDTVTTTESKLNEYPNGGFIKTFSHLSVFDDNTAEIRYLVINPANSSVQYELDWLCDISNGNDDNGLFLYDNP